MLIVKTTHPRQWSTATKGLPSNYLNETPGAVGIWGDYKFEINNTTNECDFWVIQGDLDYKETAIIRKASIFITSEEVDQKTWNKKFLDQFDIVVTTQKAIDHRFIKRDQYVCPWQIQKSYDELVSMQAPVKLKDLSSIISDATCKEGHKKRFAFMNQLKGHFKDKLNWYGRGNIFIENKWDGIVPYKYSIAIENSVHEHYWTEKIADCFLSYTIPIYYGCPNIKEYFPEGSFIQVDINELDKSIEIIENAIEEKWYEKNLDALLEARELILNRYQFFPKVISWLDNFEDKENWKRRKISLKPERHFTNKRFIEKSIKYLYSKLY